MSHYVYIIYSADADRYYVGESEDPAMRVQLHNSHFFKGSSTADMKDWKVVCIMECTDRSHARSLERWIKKQKSRRTIELLVTDPKYRSACQQRTKP